MGFLYQFKHSCSLYPLFFIFGGEGVGSYLEVLKTYTCLCAQAYCQQVLGGLYSVPGMDPGLTACKASILPFVLAHQSPHYFVFHWFTHFIFIVHLKCGRTYGTWNLKRPIRRTWSFNQSIYPKSTSHPETGIVGGLRKLLKGEDNFHLDLLEVDDPMHLNVSLIKS